MNCTACGALQPPQQGANSFEVLGLPVRVLVDEEALSTRHLELTRALHPDFHGEASPTEQAHSLAWSSQVNDAHRSVRTLVGRVGEVLAIHGRSMETAETAWRPPQDLLMEVFEINEGLDELESGSVENAHQALGSLESIVQGWKEDVRTGMVSHGEAWDVADELSREGVLDQLLVEYARHSYVANLWSRVERVKRSVGAPPERAGEES